MTQTMAEKFTPGPWRATHSRNDGIGSWYISPVEAVIPADPVEGSCIAIPADEVEANVRVMAAAPDLYASCVELRESLAAAFRAFATIGDGAVEIFEREFRATGIENGVGVRARLALDKANGAA